MAIYPLKKNAPLVLPGRGYPKNRLYNLDIKQVAKALYESKINRKIRHLKDQRPIVF